MAGDCHTAAHAAGQTKPGTNQTAFWQQHRSNVRLSGVFLLYLLRALTHTLCLSVPVTVPATTWPVPSHSSTASPAASRRARAACRASSPSSTTLAGVKGALGEAGLPDSAAEAGAGEYRGRGGSNASSRGSAAADGGTWPRGWGT